MLIKSKKFWRDNITSVCNCYLNNVNKILYVNNRDLIKISRTSVTGVDEDGEWLSIRSWPCLTVALCDQNSVPSTQEPISASRPWYQLGVAIHNGTLFWGP